MDYSGERNLPNQFANKTPQNQAMENRESYQTVDTWNQLGFDEKKAAVHKEMKRMNQLPANSSYATHRLKVLNKVLQLLTIQRTVSQDEELELLFASLSL
ncbi:uncharacterized protein LOC104448404 [Eucalyptus grandis]|uniref:Uncharacterized protein n=1 Tax=Eucalyptus globulus TaxID=34317 RepID=A0ABD3KDL9_EUCGL|nr:uncharacterized protein LOC104448404 [Eucalyptus grandis]